MIQFSVVVPIHNEAKFLPYSLPSIFRSNPNEVILLFDRCTDNSMNLAEKIAESYDYLSRTVFVRVDGQCEWKFRTAYLRRLGFKMAKNDSILCTDADMILDERISKHFSLLGKDRIALINFEYIDYPISFRNLLKRFLEFVKLPFPWLSGVHLFSRQAWMETEDPEGVKRIESADDTYLHDGIRKKYKSKIFLSKTYHLRPRENTETHYLRGQLYWNVARRSLLITLLSAITLFRPMLFVGYFHERFRESDKIRKIRVKILVS